MPNFEKLGLKVGPLFLTLFVPFFYLGFKLHVFNSDWKQKVLSLVKPLSWIEVEIGHSHPKKEDYHHGMLMLS